MLPGIVETLAASVAAHDKQMEKLVGLTERNSRK
jgi:hypothetical protein